MHFCPLLVRLLSRGSQDTESLSKGSEAKQFLLTPSFCLLNYAPENVLDTDTKSLLGTLLFLAKKCIFGGQLLRSLQSTCGYGRSLLPFLLKNWLMTLIANLTNFGGSGNHCTPSYRNYNLSSVPGRWGLTFFFTLCATVLLIYLSPVVFLLVHKFEKPIKRIYIFKKKGSEAYMMEGFSIESQQSFLTTIDSWSKV